MISALKLPATPSVRFCAAQDSELTQVLSLAQANSFLKNTQLQDIVALKTGGFLILSDESVSHILNRHKDMTVPGSKFDLDVSCIKQGIVNLLETSRPNEISGDRHKWLAQETSHEIGWDNVKHSADKAFIRSLEQADLGRGEVVRVQRGVQGERTKALSVISVKVGEVNQKPVFSLLTAFPGKNGAALASRSDFEQAGFYMVMP